MSKIGDMAASFGTPRTLKMAGCKFCGKSISSLAHNCIHCGESTRAAARAMRLGLSRGAAIVPLALLVAAALAVFIHML